MILRAASLIERVSDDERDAFENLPENLQESDRYSSMEDNADALEEISSDLSDLSDHVKGFL